MKPLFNTLTCRVPRLHRIAITVVAIAGGSFAFTPVAHAQHNATSDQVRPSSDHVRDSLFSLPVYQRAHLQTNPAIYERYQRPGLCYFAMLRSRTFYYRDKRPDTIFATNFEGAAVPIVQQVANACISKFDLANVSKDQLAPLMSVYLYLNQPRLVDSAYSRLTREYSTRDTAEIRLKANQLLGARFGLLQVKPLPDWSWPLRIADAVDALGPSAARFSMWVHDSRPWATAKLDPDAAITAYEKAEVAFRKMPRSELVDWGGNMTTKYMEWARFLFWKDGRPETVTEFSEKRFVPSMASLSPNNAEVLNQLRYLSEKWSYPYQFYGQPAPQIPAKHWFSPDGTDGTERGKFPWQGHPTIVMFVQANCGGMCYENYNLVQMFHKKFAARGLQILFVTSTKGYFRSQVPETSADEVQLIRKYYHEFLKMPVTLAIDEARFNRLPDGRRLPEDIPWHRTWPTSYSVLIGRDGKIRSLLQTQVEGLPHTLSEIEKAL